MDLVRRPVAQPLARPAVQLIVHHADLLVADVVRGPPLREVLPQEPVGVLVGPALPGVVRQREVELHAQRPGGLRVPGELLAAVGRDAAERVARQRGYGHGVDLGGRLPGRLAALQEAAPAVGEGRQARAARPAGHRVRLPVAEAGPLLGGGRALVDGVAHGYPPAPLLAPGRPPALPPVAQPPGRPSAAGAAVEEPRVDAAVDRRVAHGARPELEREPALDLLRGPLLVQELAPDELERLGVVQDARSGAGLPPLLVARLRRAGAVVRVRGRGGAHVAPELPRHGRLVPADRLRDLRDAPALAPHHRYVLALP